MTTVNNLDKRLLKRDDRFTLLDDYNDGCRVFGYKNLKLSTHRTEGKTYLWIYFDHDPYDFTAEEWHKTAGSELQNMFNGVDNINVERLVDICDKIIAEIDRLQEQILSEPEPDMTPVVERLEKEYHDLAPLLQEAKAIEWWKLVDYSRYNHSLVWAAKDIKRADESLEAIGLTINRIKYGVEPALTRKKKTELLNRLEASGYIYERTDELPDGYGTYHIKDMRDVIAKSKEVKS